MARPSPTDRIDAILGRMRERKLRAEERAFWEAHERRRKRAVEARRKTT